MKLILTAGLTAACMFAGVASAEESLSDAKADTSMLLGEVHILLEEGAVGQSKSWSNDADGTSWQATLSSKYERDGMQCGTVELAGSKVGGNSNQQSFSMCKQADGRWALGQ